MRNLSSVGFSKYCVTEDGEIYSLRVNRILAGWLDVGGYRMYSLTDDDNVIRSNLFGHRVIAQAFVEGFKDGLQVNHKNGDKSDNRICNLEWCTPSENNIHANETGLRTPTMLGEDNKVLKESEVIHDWTKRVPSGHLGEEEVIEICKLLEEGYRVCDVSRMTGYDRRFCQKIRDKVHLRWKHITSKYSFDKISRQNRASPEKVIEICKLLEKGELSMNEISSKVGVCRKTVSNIKNRKFHTGLSHGFKF